jgi:hypothetical protein
MTVYFLVDDDNLVANMAMYPDGMVPSEIASNWLSTEETDIGGKVYNSSDKTFSAPTGDLIGIEPTNQL